MKYPCFVISTYLTPADYQAGVVFFDIRLEDETATRSTKVIDCLDKFLIITLTQYTQWASGGDRVFANRKNLDHVE